MLLGRYLLALLAFCALVAHAEQPQDSDKLSFMHLGDPQFGYSLDTKRGVTRRMAQLAEEINNQKPDFVLIPGDLVQDRTLAQRWAFEKSIEDIEAPILLTPGNHDLVNEGDLDSYRRHFGEDFFVQRFGWLWVVSLNSEILRDQNLSSSEFDRQWRWLESKVDEFLESNDQDQMVFMMHRPPIVYGINEPDSDANWPLNTRMRLLELAQKAGVKVILAGHTHTTLEIPVPDFSLHIYTVGGAARVFDERGTGYRLFEISPSNYHQKYVQTASPPNVASGWMGYNQWTPRLWDFSVRHWLWTAVFGALGLYMIVRARSRENLSRKGWRRLMLICGCWYLFFAVNMQLDFDELTTEVLRQVVTDGLIQQYRHLISPVVVGIIALFLGGGLLWYCRDRHLITTCLVLALMLPTLAWYSFQIMSNSYFGIVWPESTWDAIFTASIIGLVAMLVVMKKQRKADLARYK